MTQLYSSSAKLFSLLYSSNKSGRHQQQHQQQQHNSSISSNTTHIAVITQKDGTVVTRCLNRRPLTSPTDSSISNSTSQSSKKQRCFAFLKFSGLRNRSSPLVAGPSSSPLPSCDILQRLPPEVIQLVLVYLDCASIATLSRTNRHMHAVCSDDGLWRTLLTRHFGARIKHPILPASDYYRHHSLLEKRWQRGQAQARYMVGHTDSVYCIMRYDERYLVSGSRDHSIRIWDLATYTCVASRTHHDGSVLCLKIQRDSGHHWMVSGSSDGTCVIWHSLPALVPVHRLRGHTNGVLDVCIVNEWIVSASRDGTVRVWDQLTAKEIRRLDGHGGPVNALQQIRGTSHVVSASGDGTLKVWNVDTGECLRTLVGHLRGLACAKYDPMAGRIFSGGQDALLKVWNANTGDCKATLVGHDQLIRTVDCYGDRVITGSYDRTLKVWDANTGQCLLNFQNAHDSWIFNALISPTQIISAGQDKRILVLDFGHDLHLGESSC